MLPLPLYSGGRDSATSCTQGRGVQDVNTRPTRDRAGETASRQAWSEGFTSSSKSQRLSGPDGSPPERESGRRLGSSLRVASSPSYSPTRLSYRALQRVRRLFSDNRTRIPAHFVRGSFYIRLVLSKSGGEPQLLVHSNPGHLRYRPLTPPATPARTTSAPPLPHSRRTASSHLRRTRRDTPRRDGPVMSLAAARSARPTA